MKILLVTGSNGQVASEYKLTNPLFDWDVVFCSKEDLDISSIKSIKQVLSEIKPDAILNLAAYTNVEKAEKECTSLAFNVNAKGPKNLASACHKHNIPLIHISTDYVFDGNSIEPYTENYVENPINQYGRTKYLGEKWIQEVHDWYYIIRVSWVYSNHSKNFYTTMLKMAQERSEVSVVNDQYGSPTSSKEVCRAIDIILSDLDRKKTGIYHFTGLGKTSWKEFADEIFKQLRSNIIVRGVPSSAWPSKLERPTNSYLSSDKFGETFGHYPMHWKNALLDIISESKIIPVKVGDLVMLNDVQHIIVTTDWIKKIARISPLTDINASVEISFDLLFI